METESSNADLLEPGLRKKKKRKKMERGENKMYDSGKADAAQNKADEALDDLVSKQTGLNPFKKKKKGA